MTAFYRRAAALQDSLANKDFLETIAKMEDRHKAGFENMLTRLSDLENTQTVFDPNDELVLYLKAMADYDMVIVFYGNDSWAKEDDDRVPHFIMYNILEAVVD